MYKVLYVLSGLFVFAIPFALFLNKGGPPYVSLLIVASSVTSSLILAIIGRVLQVLTQIRDDLPNQS